MLFIKLHWVIGFVTVVCAIVTIYLGIWKYASTTVNYIVFSAWAAWLILYVILAGKL